MSYLRFSPSEYRAMADLYGEIQLAGVNLTAFGCLLSFELSDAWPGLARRIDGLSDRELRLLREWIRGRPGPAFSAAELAAVAAAWPMPRTGRFTRPPRRTLLLCLMANSPKLARKVARLSGDGFEWLCEQLPGRRGADA
jgi:hypothetical protein